MTVGVSLFRRAAAPLFAWGNPARDTTRDGLLIIG
jgi:hypothetical protein